MNFLLFFASIIAAEAISSSDYYPTFRTLVLDNSTIGYNKKDSPYDVFRKNVTVNVGVSFVVLTKVVG